MTNLIIYESADGMQFDTEKQCIDYERNNFSYYEISILLNDCKYFTFYICLLNKHYNHELYISDMLYRSFGKSIEVMNDRLYRKYIIRKVTQSENALYTDVKKDKLYFMEQLPVPINCMIPNSIIYNGDENK
jgi:hypothetical protein